MATPPHLEIEGGAERQRYELPEAAAEITIGRSADCQWVIPSGAVSRRHAVLRRRGAELIVEDLGSSNGTMVNGERLTGPRMLRDQDKLQLGAVEIRVVIPSPPPPPAADATIAVDATRRVAPDPAADQTRVATPRGRQPSTSGAPHSGKTATETMAPRLPLPLPAAPAAEAAPSLLELAIIAAGSFVVVFAIGAVLIRFVF